MKTLSILFLSFFILLIFGLSEAQALEPTIYLSLGEPQRLPLSGNDSVWIQDGKILKAQALAGKLQIHGLKEGATTLKIGKKIYLVQVLHPQGLASHAEFSKNIRRIIGLKLEREEGQLVVRGRLYRWSDWVTLKNLSQRHRVNYSFSADIPFPLRSGIQQAVDQLISEAHLPAQTLIFSSAPELRVSASALHLKKYEQLLKPFGIEITKDESSLELAPTVKVQITVAEVRKSFGVQYGIKWPDMYSAKIVPGGLERTEDLLFNAKAFENQGYGKILASPNIICRSGKEAEFLAGGEFPIKILNYKVQDIVWKRYGILLRVRPKADSAGRISLSLETEISTLDKATAVDGIPGLLTNRVSSHFDLSRPQTIALSGLLKNEEGQSSGGVPLLSRVPILGPLFSSKEFLENKTELVIFVRPTILKEAENSELTHLGPQEAGAK